MHDFDDFQEILLENDRFDPHGLALNFVHRRIIGGIRGLLTGGPVGAVAGVLTSGGSTAVANVPEPKAIRDLRFTCNARGQAVNASLTACIVPPGPGSFTVDPTALMPGGRPLFSGVAAGDAFGAAEMGRFGAGLIPASTDVRTRRCPRGAVLAVDGLCYNRRDLRKSDRMWPPGRKPLLTGGDLNAISRATRAARRIETQTKRLQKLGLLAKPRSRSRKAVSHHHD